MSNDKTRPAPGVQDYLDVLERMNNPLVRRLELEIVALRSEYRMMRDEVLRASERLKLIRAHNDICQGSLQTSSDCFPSGSISVWINEHEAALEKPNPLGT